MFAYYLPYDWLAGYVRGLNEEGAEGAESGAIPLAPSFLVETAVNEEGAEERKGWSRVIFRHSSYKQP